ncbi:hypothetical protein IMZ31_16860 [Pontibacillus sp. ALD_SL1]|uniref:hypothetical protein n=1 Tax=Pontibacillus sp. ALD_SL1 TaxID=2777185 RepID=UPI001A96BBEE|nr:hypothetical protein [Pontibacillus sp. ALD_SL1]QSS99712.1 hypothetical protein IMZ31_16860 [Pontibacillus sp. ALD_SL1]
MIDIASFEKRIEFIKSALEHAERRIEILDQKASILIAIQGGFLVLILALFKDYFGGYVQLFEQAERYRILSNLFVLISLCLTFYVMILLILTIRPKLKFFSSSMPYAPIDASRYIFWFDKRAGNLVTHVYEDAVDGMNYLIIWNVLGVLFLLIFTMF